MATHAPRLRSIYRSLLRELPPRPILRSPRTPLHSRLRESFASTEQTPSPSSSSSSSSTPAASPSAAAEAARAEQLATYLRSQRSYVTLVERYNPGMNLEEEERLRLTARKVGMDMPVEFVAGEGEGEGEQKK